MTTRRIASFPPYSKLIAISLSANYQLTVHVILNRFIGSSAMYPTSRATMSTIKSFLPLECASSKKQIDIRYALPHCFKYGIRSSICAYQSHDCFLQIYIRKFKQALRCHCLAEARVVFYEGRPTHNRLTNQYIPFVIAHHPETGEDNVVILCRPKEHHGLW